MGIALPIPTFDFTHRYITGPETWRLHEPAPAPQATGEDGGIAPEPESAEADDDSNDPQFDLGLPAPELRPAVDPDLAPRLSYEQFCSMLVEVAQRNELPVGFFANLIWQESRFDHRAVSRAGAQGVAQFMPDTAGRMGLDNPFDAREALPASGRLLRILTERFGGNLGLAAAAYNAGPKRVIDWLSKRAALPRETRDYIRTITGRPADRWDDGKPQVAVFRVPARVPCHRVASFSEVEQAERARMEFEQARIEAELAEKRRIEAEKRRLAEQEARASTLRKRAAGARRVAENAQHKRQAAAQPLSVSARAKSATNSNAKAGKNSKHAELKAVAKKQTPRLDRAPGKQTPQIKTADAKRPSKVGESREASSTKRPKGAEQKTSDRKTPHRKVADRGGRSQAN
jgi:hypothetical protein